MASLADRVLGDHAPDDDLDLEDPELAKQLAELQARRAARGGGTAPLAGPDAAPAHSAPEYSAPEPSAPEPSEAAPAAARPATLKPKSLADQVLAGAGGGSDELEAMEQELETQLSQYRKQRETPTGNRGREVQGEIASEAAAPEAVTESPAPKSDAKGESEALGQLDGGDPVTDAALVALRQEAANMDVAFPGRDDPEAVQAAKAAPKPKARREGAWKSSRESDRKEAPVPEEILELQSLLSDVDARLQGIQDRHELSERQSMRGENASSEGARAIAELQAQNAHLRDRLADPKKKGLLDLDHSVFGLVNAKPDST